MNSRFINLLGAAALTVSLASCAAASEDLSSSSVKAEQKTVAVEAEESNDSDNYKQIYAFTHDWKVKTTNCFDYYMVNIY